DRLASKILGMGDVLTLIEKAEKEFDEKEAEVMAKRMLRIEFTLEDFAFQLKQVSKLGSMSDLLGMLPNMGINRDMAAANLDDKKIKHMMAIIDSMTPKERQKPKILNGRRRIRISKGSGRTVQEVNQLIKRFFEAQKMMKKPIFRKMLKKFDFLSKMG
ncbi:MAG: signal recognition particle protein, partial [Candidatus Aminicenantes bacterium]|nr:signal recognition particle protein [Candidatus Aminicenantes bacterium]